MNCLSCEQKSCKQDAKDCNGNRADMVALYQNQAINDVYSHADNLVAGGKAGQLSRLEEIMLFCKAQHYNIIGIAYCFSMESLAKQTSDYLISQGLRVRSYRCTLNGIKECEINPNLGRSVNCNPLGQAQAINQEPVDFVIEMGLCLGHDVLFHQHLKKPFTVFVVKDRVHDNDPKRFLVGEQHPKEEFIEALDSSLGMKTPLWLLERMKSPEHLVIIDLRAPEAYLANHIKDSVNIPLKALPHRYHDYLLNKSADIVCVCNGSVQSAYAIMFLHSQGYKHVHNLSGGFSRWEKENTHEPF